MNKPIIGIVGGSGTGKSTSLRRLPANRTTIIDLERKGFPFKEAKMFNIISVDKIPDVNLAIEKAIQNSDIVVFESFTKYCQQLSSYAGKMYKGHHVRPYYNKQIRDLLDNVKNEKAIFIFTAIDEIARVTQPTGVEYNTRRPQGAS
jgi:hypothetical protein